MLPVLRRSAIQTAKSCLFRYNKLWNENVPDQSDNALRGIGFHAAAHAYIRRLVQAHVPQDAEEAIAAFSEGMASALTPAHLVPEVRQLFDRWAESFELELDYFIAAEERQHSKSDFEFTPDLIYGKPHELEILDFKTYFQPMTEIQAAADWQARFYIRAAKTVWPNFPRYRFTFSFVRYGTYVSVVFKDSDLDLLDREVAAVAATIEEATRRNEWPATPGVECSYCQLACPIVDNDVMAPKRILDAHTAETIAGWIMAGDQMIGAAKKALKAYCSAHGPITVGGMVWDNRPTTSRSYPAQAVVAALDKVRQVGGLEPVVEAEQLTFSHSALKAVFKRFPLIEQELETVATTKQSWRFSAKKPGELESGDED
jgi:hypothetical protein